MYRPKALSERYISLQVGGKYHTRERLCIKRDDMMIAGKTWRKENKAQTTFAGERLSIEWNDRKKAGYEDLQQSTRGQGRADPD